MAPFLISLHLPGPTKVVCCVGALFDFFVFPLHVSTPTKVAAVVKNFSESLVSDSVESEVVSLVVVGSK